MCIVRTISHLHEIEVLLFHLTIGCLKANIINDSRAPPLSLSLVLTNINPSSWITSCVYPVLGKIKPSLRFTRLRFAIYMNPIDYTNNILFYLFIYLLMRTLTRFRRWHACKYMIPHECSRKIFSHYLVSHSKF